MEFTISKDKLARGVQMVERVVSTKSTLPIIGNVLFEAQKGKLKLSANNLEMGMEVEVPAEVQKEGSILVPAKTLAGIVSKLPNTKISFKVNDRGLVKISYNESHLGIHGLPADEFPTLPKIKENKVFKVESGQFASMIAETIFSVSSSEDKYVLTGVLLEVGKSKTNGDSSNLRLVATDGYRLAKRGEKVTGITAAHEMSVIVPAKALGELNKVIAESSGDLSIIISAEQIAFKYGDVYIVSRLIQGQFPDYKQVIPKKSKTTIISSTSLFLESAQRAAVIASSNANIIRLEIKDGKLHVIANTPDVGQVDEVLPVEIKGEEKAQVAFNVRLLMDVLKVLETEKVTLELSGPLNPGLLRPTEGSDYTYVVMPIRTQEAAA
ncbi:MAG: DNA polymerase III subunit beta [Candidatus Margulisbacteria bacterium]|nr:DNA polymerase III subunit beta [Candidatus Margulisiibacteriota bacterium]MBU1021980.1 DNA polymerase III subunit beta [Candidatus Margulisiibacteriota bacterium]MBU1728958.1 DNA polymerase III subunit beta [Candidatus Margulisiibacteriota bacterium]MBU1954764.1 DNA polymerase III subunit beta [Candidatus Margulisiibacteriota bacterium]